VDHLWSPWRLEYVTGEKPKAGCVFCLQPVPASGGVRPADPGPRDPLIVHHGQLCYVILNLYPYNNGHLLVVPYRHEPTLAGLAPEEMHEAGLLTQRAETALREAYHLEGINVGVNLGRVAGAGIVEHVHVHVVPRWHGDTNFMTVVGQTRVLPEKLEATAGRLRPIFERLAAAGSP
jgi:ATP adenylyltransferase